MFWDGAMREAGPFCTLTLCVSCCRTLDLVSTVATRCSFGAWVIDLCSPVRRRYDTKTKAQTIHGRFAVLLVSPGGLALVAR